MVVCWYEWYEQYEGYGPKPSLLFPYQRVGHVGKRGMRNMRNMRGMGMGRMQDSCYITKNCVCCFERGMMGRGIALFAVSLPENVYVGMSAMRSMRSMRGTNGYSAS